MPMNKKAAVAALRAAGEALGEPLSGLSDRDVYLALLSPEAVALGRGCKLDDREAARLFRGIAEKTALKRARL